MAVTLSGAFGTSEYSLSYTLADQAYKEAEKLITNVDLLYNKAVYYAPGAPLVRSGALIIGSAVAQHSIFAVGFGAVVDEDNSSKSTVFGGVAGGYQVVLAGDGGLTYAYQAKGAGNVTVDAGGGNNNIDLLADAGSSAIYTGAGNDSIYGSGGNVTISAGAGINVVRLGGGADLDLVTGTDKVFLGGGKDTIRVSGAGSALVYGAKVASASGYNLTFVGGTVASTVQAGAGSYLIYGGAGGGEFFGGSAGNNVITGGSGNVTIYGGGSGDVLTGGSGDNLIVAGPGNETLNGGTGAEEILKLVTTRTSGTGTTDTITDFQPGKDIIELNGGAANAYALHTYSIVDGSGTFYLLDGTKVVLQGYTGPLTESNLKH